MSIEFRCAGCQKLLQVPEGSAGRKAKCPHCGEVGQIPEASTSASSDTGSPFDSPFNTPAPNEPASEFGPEAFGSPASGGSSPFADTPLSSDIPGETGNPYQSPTALDDRQFHEESAIGGSIQPTKVPILNFLARSMRVFQARMGITVGLFVLFMVVFLLFYAGLIVGIFFEPFIIVPIAGVVMLLVMPLLVAGLMKGMLLIARGKRASVAELFRGGHWYLRTLGYGIIFWIIAITPYLLAIYSVEMLNQTDNPLFALGAFVGLVLYFLIFLWFGFGAIAIVDQDCGVFKALAISWRITSINTFRMILAYILLGLCMFAIIFVFFAAMFVLALIPFVGPIIMVIGMLVFYVAFLFLLYPYMMTFYVAGYLQMSGQPLAYQPDGFVRRRPMPEADLNSGTDSNPFAS